MLPELCIVLSSLPLVLYRLVHCCDELTSSITAFYAEPSNPNTLQE